MSIVVAHGYSMMYLDQQQAEENPAGVLAEKVVPTPFAAATFLNGVAPVTKGELDQFNSADDFDVTNLSDAVGDPAAWNSDWTYVYWVKVGSRYYKWATDEWVTAPLTDGALLDPIPGIGGEDEMLFIGRYPQTKAELESITPTVDGDPVGHFTTGRYVSVIGVGGPDKYFWTGSVWLPGVSDD
jgi:hypothetical protein